VRNDEGKMENETTVLIGSLQLGRQPAILCFFPEEPFSKHSVEQYAERPARAPSPRLAGNQVSQPAQRTSLFSRAALLRGDGPDGTVVPGELIMLTTLRTN